MKKQISSKPFISMMKDIKDHRKEMQKRVIDFNSELADKINRNDILCKELGEVATRINQLRHMIEMYKVNDDHKLMLLWELEKACGLTDKKYPDWKFDFEKTKDGWVFKT